jgi:biotin carboxyl carrier protein
MKWNVHIGDKTTQVELPQSMTPGHVYTAKVGDRTLDFRFDGTTLSEVSKGGGRELNIRLRSPNVAKLDSEFAVEFDYERGGTAGQVKAHVEAYTPGGAHKSARKKSGLVRSEITGKVLRVTVQKGAAVNAGDPLCIIEAMKMENKVFAVQAGTLAEVFIQDGAAVKAGDKLFSIAPNEK